MYPIAVYIHPFQCTELQIEQAFANGSFWMTIEFTVKTPPYLQYRFRQGRRFKTEALQTLLSDGAPSCLVLVALHHMAHLV
jgi:hypothetical protein